MERKIIIPILMCMILLSLASAVKPDVQTSEAGLDIRFPQTDTVMQNRDVTYHVHAFNKSDGLMVGITTTNCSIHLYNSSGSHILQEDMNWDSNQKEWAFFIKGGNFSTIQRMSAIVWCNGTAEGGFASFGFEVTYNGKSLSEAQSLLYIPLFMLAIFFFVMIIFGINRLPEANAKDEDGKLLQISWLKYLRSTLWFVEWILLIGVIFISSNISRAYLPDNLISEVLFKMYIIFLSLTPLVIVLWFLWIFVKFIDDRKLKDMMERGMFGQTL